MRRKGQTKDICRRRKQLLYEHLQEFKMTGESHSTSFYNEFDLLVWAKIKYSEDFVNYLKENRHPLEFLFELANAIVSFF